MKGAGEPTGVEDGVVSGVLAGLMPLLGALKVFFPLPLGPILKQDQSEMKQDESAMKQDQSAMKQRFSNEAAIQ